MSKSSQAAGDGQGGDGSYLALTAGVEMSHAAVSASQGLHASPQGTEQCWTQQQQREGERGNHRHMDTLHVLNLARSWSQHTNMTA